jgi:polyvinyl alcohol dehydrogenase (cytochrome)
MLSVVPIPLGAFHPLKQVWQAKTGGAIAATPAVGGGTVYVGSWDGIEYAYRETSGRRLWRTYLGRTTDPACGPEATLGITSGAQIVGHVLYVGGGDLNWNALGTQDGKLRWRINTVQTVPASQRSGYYNWSTPAIYHGSAYVGLASQCDQPLTQGKLLRVSLASHKVKAVWDAVPDYQIGGGVWTTPVVDPKANTVFVTTGTRATVTEKYVEAVVALDATTLRVKSHWTLPVADRTLDSDWGTSPVLGHDSRGRSLVAAINKNGFLYAFQRTKLGAGPVWKVPIARAGPSPQAGDGTASTGVFAQGRFFFAAGATTIGGQAYPGSVRAIDPATGRFLWQVGLPSEVLGALKSVRGMLVVPAAYGGLYLLSEATGTVLHANILTGTRPDLQPMYAAPRVADGYVFIGTTDGVVHTFKLPATP